MKLLNLRTEKIPLVGIFLFCLNGLFAQVFPSDSILIQQNMLRIDTLNGVRVELKYSTEANFLNQNVYEGYKKVWLHKDAVKKLKKAIRYLKMDCAKCEFVVYDGLRPRSVQKIMREVAHKKQKSIYVSRPYPGSVHNFGMAIDLSVIGSKGQLVDMGTPFDFFGPQAQPQKEDSLLFAKALTEKQVLNRRRLRDIMLKAGWVVLPTEWWHFNAYGSNWVRENYEIIE